jgi:hypothetical protein
VIRTPDLHLRGLDRNRVVIDGRHRKGVNGIALRTGDVWVENLTVRNFDRTTPNAEHGGNEVWWYEAHGWHGNYLTVYDTGLLGGYGLFAERTEAASGITFTPRASTTPASTSAPAATARRPSRTRSPSATRSATPARTRADTSSSRTRSSATTRSGSASTPRRATRLRHSSAPAPRTRIGARRRRSLRPRSAAARSSAATGSSPTTT